MCPKSEASAGWPCTICSGHFCKLQNRLRVDAVQRQACFLPLPPKSSCASPPGRGGKAWEGARPTSRVPARSEGTGTRVLSNLNCVAFPAARMPDGHLSVTFDDIGQRCDRVEEGCVVRRRLQIQNEWSNQNYHQAQP